MNIFDDKIDISDEDFLLRVKAIDNSGAQKIINLIDSVRALLHISKTSWYFGKSVGTMDIHVNPMDLDEIRNPTYPRIQDSQNSGNLKDSGNSQNSRNLKDFQDSQDSQDSQEIQNPLICAFQNSILSIQELLKLEFWSWTPQHLARNLECVEEFKAILERELESSINSNNTTFTSSVEFARQCYPVVLAIRDSLVAIYEQAAYNTISILDLESHLKLSEDYTDSLNARPLGIQDRSDSLDILGNQNNSKNSDIPDVFGAQNYSDSSGNQNNPKIPGIQNNRETDKTRFWGQGFEKIPNYLGSEESHFQEIVAKLAYTLRMCQDEPQTAKSLMGANLIDLLRKSSLFFNSRGQSLSRELKDGKIW